MLKADDGARVVLRAVAAEAPTKVKRSFFSSLLLLASVLYTIYALGLKAIFAIPLYAATLQKPTTTTRSTTIASPSPDVEPPPKEKSSESDHSLSRTRADRPGNDPEQSRPVRHGRRQGGRSRDRSR